MKLRSSEQGGCPQSCAGPGVKNKGVTTQQHPHKIIFPYICLMIRETITIEITQLEVDERYYSFEYHIKIRNEDYTGTYDSDHSWDDPEEFKKVLEEQEAINLAIGEVFS